MERARQITWYLYSEDVFTQGSISERLDASLNCIHGCLCADGEKRDLWKSDYALIDFLKKSRAKGEGFDFQVFKQVGNGPIKFFKGFSNKRYQKETQALVQRARQMRREQLQRAAP